MKCIREVRDNILVVMVCALQALRWIVSNLMRSTLFWAWFAGYLSVMSYGLSTMYSELFFEVSFTDVADLLLWFLIHVTYVIVPMLVLWSGLIACGAVVSLYYMYKQRQLQRQLFLLYLRYPQFFQPQGGEKEIRREQYLKNVQSRRKEKAKRKSPPKIPKEKKCKNRTYTPQLGVLTSKLVSTFQHLAATTNLPINDDVLNKIENLGALYAILRDAASTSQLCGALFLYFKTHYKRSVAMNAAEYLAEICDMEFSTQGGGKFVPQASSVLNQSQDTQTGNFKSYLKDADKPNWLKLLKECQDNWTLVIRNEGFVQISKILSLAIGLGLCEASSLDFRVAGMKLFSIGAAAKQASAIDMIDAVFETVVYFAEGGYACFERGSIKPLLYGNMENEDFEENFGICQQSFDYAKSGNLSLVEMDENDYEQLLCLTIEKCQQFVQTSRGPVEKNVFRRKLDMLRSWQSSFRQTRVQGGLRVAPYSIGVFGGTGVGKSSVANIMMVTTLLHNGFAATDDRIITLNETDKYMSNYRTYINGIFLDDIGNTKPDYVEKAPTTLMIQLVNNVRLYANMAEAELKGKVSVQPKVVIGTKNVKDTCASVYSNEPASIARRDRITLTVKVKDQFRTNNMLDPDKVEKFYGEEIPLIPDLWDITVERAFPVKSAVKGAKDTIGWQVLSWNGALLRDISIKQLIRYVAEDSKSYYVAQEKLVDNQNNLAEKFVICESCRLVSDVCTCQQYDPILQRVDKTCPNHGYCTACGGTHWEQSYDTQFGMKIATMLHHRYWRISRLIKPKLEYWSDVAEDQSVDWMVKRLDWLETSPYTIWTNWVPTEWLARDLFRKLVWFTNETKLRERIRSAYRNHMILAGSLSIASFIHPFFSPLILGPLFSMGRIVEVEKKKLYDEVSTDNRAMPAIFKLYRDKHIKWITGICVTIAALYAVAMVWKSIRVIPSPQGNLAPTCDREIVERDAEINPWSGVVVSEMPCSEKAKTTPPDVLEKLVLKNMAYLELRPKGTDKVYECDAFFPCSNVAIVPNHMWLADDIKVSITRHDPNTIGGNFETWLYKGHSYQVPNTDLSFVWVPNGGDWKDLTAYFPTNKFASAPARFIYKKENGQQLLVGGKTPRLKMNPGYVNTRACGFSGATYNLPFESFEGLCMGALVTETKGPLIGGFHLGGINGRVEGCCGLLTQSQCYEALTSLSKMTGVVLSKSEGTVPKKLYDMQFYQGPEVHSKSAINWLPKGAYCKYYGQCTGRSTYHSEVEETVISKIVDEVTGVPQKWGPPKFRVGWPFQASLQYSTKPSQGIEGSLLVRAAKDFIRPILMNLDKMPGMKAEVRPLTEMETVCGIDGRRFIDKLPPSTSVGYPLSGPKSKFLKELDPSDYPSHQYPTELDPMFWKHAYEMEERYLAGERAYPIFKACLKDEATKLTKDKVRVFQGAPTALQLLVRRYFLPIARILSMMPLTTECAVGVNAQGPEWDQLAKHVKSFGANRILAGDYSKYDLRMPAQVMFTAFRIMIDIGKYCGYSDRDIKIMEGIATDICYPLMAYNGDLIQHYGSNPSGQNLTVYINSIVNALLFRCAFFEICKNRRSLPAFKDVCALITYGDDAKSSVHHNYQEFNHISVAKFLEERDMRFTMPDKESEPTPYMTDEQADLLKRKNIFCEDTGRIMGALDEDSIFKSLHSVVRSKVLTREQQAMQVLDGALREWFSYGRDHYEMRRGQMKTIAERAGISHGCTMLESSYDDQLQGYHEKYDTP